MRMAEFYGCWYPVAGKWGRATKQYLAQVELRSHTTILAITSRTVLTQTFINTDDKKLDEVQYSFPLYDGVSVVGFKCTVGTKTIVGIVKEKQQARADYTKAVARGETAGLLEQLRESSDVFTTKIGNVPAGEKIVIEIIYLGELKHDAETDGTRFTIPTNIAPRYGQLTYDSQSDLNCNVGDRKGISILVDVALDSQSIIRGIQSPSHPIAVTMGRTSSMEEDEFNNHNASATLTLGTAELIKDFVIVILSKEQDIPRALLETHPTIPNQRAVMTTLVPKFNIPNIIPEIVFVVDRSGSMDGKIPTLVSAMKIFLKSLPANGIKFNICSFGSSYSFLFDKSRTYDQSSLKEALHHLDSFDAEMGGTEMLKPIQAIAKTRYKDMPLEVMVLTDGEIWNQEAVFRFINEQKNARFFSLGIGDGASTALVEGIARAGGGFAQFVAENEKMDKRVVRMLKGALTPHIADYSLEVRYGESDTNKASDDDDFEMVESFNDSVKDVVTDLKKPITQRVISLFNPSAQEEPITDSTDRYSGLPKFDVPKVLQTPHKVPGLFAFSRTTVCLLLGPESCQRTPKSVILRGTSDHGPLELKIPVENVGRGETLHQLAAKKAVQELEEGRGWITEAKANGSLIKSRYEGRWDLIVEREAVRLGVQFQVGGKWCSFVAVEEKGGNEMDVENKNEGSVDTMSGKQSISSPFGPVSFGSNNAFAYAQRATNPCLSSDCKVSSLFGSSGSTQGSALFGQSSTPFQTTTTASHSGGLFVNATTSIAGSCFGATPGSTTVTPSLFGNATANPLQPFPGTEGRLFDTVTPETIAAQENFWKNRGGMSHRNRDVVNPKAPQVFSLGSTKPSSAMHPDLFSIPVTSQTAYTDFTQSTKDASSASLFTAQAPASVAQDQNADNPLAESVPPTYSSVPGKKKRASPNALFGSSRSAAPSGGGGYCTVSCIAPRKQLASRAARRSAHVSGEPLADEDDPPSPEKETSAELRGQVDHSFDGIIEGEEEDVDDFSDEEADTAVSPVYLRAASPAYSPASPSHSPISTQAIQQATINASVHQCVSQASPPPPSDGFGSKPAAYGWRSRSIGDNGTKRNVKDLTDDEKMHLLIEMQEFDGSWKVSQELMKLFGKVFTTTLKPLGNVEATALAVAWLETKMKSEKEVWEMIVEKARSWLESNNDQVGELMKKAEKVFTRGDGMLNVSFP